MFYYYDPTYWLIILGAIVALYAQIKVSTTYFQMVEGAFLHADDGRADAAADFGWQRLRECAH